MINVLIAEDDFRVASIHEQFLQKIDNVNLIGKSSNAKETLELLKKHDNIDLLLLDVYMPDKMGTEILPIIRNLYPEVDIIMITAATEKKHLEESLRSGVFHYLIKPVTVEKFTETIKKYIEKKELLLSMNEVDQSFADHYFGGKLMQSVEKKIHYPKGIDPLSLEKVREIISQLESGITAEEMGERMGASRTTARRYLEYLTSNNEVTAELEYGIVGRPERKYLKLK
ncbi:response regulator [Fredinandcohnia sp. QZ13]|uniref:response regulator n=1 Tax=Fredinandcohnia sp. QZ13 TaxID=3073144 RepID=UPI002853171C|nr:response regulator [Fredinandcohnia sp. QZ13]MDR4887156.1 response regulator [Fredinandcohnia sp. QZ13]